MTTTPAAPVNLPDNCATCGHWPFNHHETDAHQLGRCHYPGCRCAGYISSDTQGGLGAPVSDLPSPGDVKP